MKELVLNVPLDHYQKEALAQYDDVCLAMVREFLQNSIDAGSKTVAFEFTDNRARCTDTGSGLTLPEFQDRMLTLGGSHKNTGAAGGFGAAKKLLLFAHRSWKVVGQGFACEGTYHQNIYASEDKGRAKGLDVSSQSDLINQESMTRSVSDLAGMSRVRANISVNGKTVKQGRALRKNQKATEFSFGTLYCHKGPRSNYESPGYMYIRTNGIFTAKQWVGGQWVWYLEINKGESKNVLSENRQALRSEFSRFVHPYISAANSLRSVEKLDTFICDIFGLHFGNTGDSHPEAGEMELTSHAPSGGTEDSDHADSAPSAPQEPTARLSGGEIKSYHYEDEQDPDEQDPAEQDPGEQGPAGQGSNGQGLDEYIPGGEQGHNEQQEQGELWKENAEAMGYGGVNTIPHIPEVQRVDPSESWRKPYGVMANGKTPKIFTEDGYLKPKQAKALEIVNLTLNLVADALDLPRPVPCLLYSRDALGCFIKSNNNYAIGLDVDTVTDGAPFFILSVALHEFAHYFEEGHTSWFLEKKESLEETIGERAIPILGAISRAQEQKRKPKAHWVQ
jgi:hypothetical protein